LLAVVGAGDKIGLSDFRSTNTDRVKQSLDALLPRRLSTCRRTLTSIVSFRPIPRVLNHVPLRDPSPCETASEAYLDMT